MSGLERDLGLRPKALNEYEDPEDEAACDPIKDAEIFLHSVNHTFSEIRAKHRDRINTIKLTEYEQFVKLRKNAGSETARPSTAQHPYE